MILVRVWVNLGWQMFDHKIFVVAVAVFASAMSMGVEAKLYKWIDDSGNTHYGEVIPPEYAGKEKDSSGQPTKSSKQVVIVSPEMIREKSEEETKKVAVKKELEEKKRRNYALMNTYSNENEIDLARDRSLALISARIESNSILLKSSQRTVLDLKSEVATRTNEGKKIPQSLTDDSRLAEDKVARYQLELRKSEEEYSAVKLRFENDKIQYRKIVIMKSGSAPEINDYQEYSDSESVVPYPTYSKRAKKSRSRQSY